MRASAAAGAGFVVSPGLVPEVVETAHELGLEAVPGVFTATEIIVATAAGARVMKLLPGLVRRARRTCARSAGRFPTIALVPTGGVRVDEIQAYVDAGASVVALGSELVGRERTAVGRRSRLDHGTGRAGHGGRSPGRSFGG